jgi:uncharacterized membrane protein
MADNITPFPVRRPPPKPPLRDGGDARRIVLGAHALTIAAFAAFMFLGQPLDLIGYVVGAAALLIAASKRTEGPPWAARHYEFVLRTIIIGAVAWTLNGLLGMIPGIGMVTGIVTWVILGWVAIRCGSGLWQGARGLAIDNPKTLFL